MTGDIDQNQMSRKKQSGDDEKFSLKKWFKKLIKKIVESRTFLAILMLAIGISWTVVYYEGRSLLETAHNLFASRTVTFIINPVLASEAKKEVEAEKPLPKVEEKLDLEKLVRETFKNEPDLAVAVAKGESRLYNYTHLNNAVSTCVGGYENCKPGEYKGECSVGIFQINLAENGCNGKWVHAEKVPGETMQEKIEWLRVPQNNIKFAKQLYDQSGWGIWGAYTNGSYKQFLK